MSSSGVGPATTRFQRTRGAKSTRAPRERRSARAGDVRSAMHPQRIWPWQALRRGWVHRGGTPCRPGERAWRALRADVRVGSGSPSHCFGGASGRAAMPCVESGSPPACLDAASGRVAARRVESGWPRACFDGASGRVRVDLLAGERAPPARRLRPRRAAQPVRTASGARQLDGADPCGPCRVGGEGGRRPNPGGARRVAPTSRCSRRPSRTRRRGGDQSVGGFDRVRSGSSSGEGRDGPVRWIAEVQDCARRRGAGCRHGGGRLRTSPARRRLRRGSRACAAPSARSGGVGCSC